MGYDAGRPSPDRSLRDARSDASRPGEALDAGGFRHEALFYDGDESFDAPLLAWLREGAASGDRTQVMLGADKIDRLRRALGAAAARVQWVDVTGVGLNPARLIPALSEFIEAAGARPARAACEAIWPGRSDAEVSECDRHEALLHLAFAGRRAPFFLLCPYDSLSLDPSTVAQAVARHVEPGGDDPPLQDAGPRGVTEVVFGPLPPAPPSHAIESSVDGADKLEPLRGFVAAHAATLGLPAERVTEFVVAVNEVATNSIRHGGGRGLLRLWRDDDDVVCEVRDTGRIHDPLVGRRRPSPERATGFGLWIANQICDLVQIRSASDGTSVRLLMRV